MTSPDELLMKVMADPASIPDPHPIYKELRETAPLFKAAWGDTWIVSGFENCRALLRDSRCGQPMDEEASASRIGIDGERRRAPTGDGKPMLFMNPPDHTRVRGLVSRAFTPRRVELLRGEIEAQTDALLDALSGEGDFVDKVAFPLPANVISALVGVPEEKRDWLRPLISDIVPTIEPTATEEALDKADIASAKASEYLQELIQIRRADPQDDMLSALIQASDGEDRLTEGEVMSNIFLIYAAGFETTTHLLGNMVRQLVAHPEQLQRLRDDRSLIPSAVEEVLRFDPPVQLDGRFVFEDIEIDGETIAKGSSIITLLAAANRDPAVCTNPDTFDVGRTDIQLMSFGSGIHFCLGAALARMEGQVVLERLIDRYESWEITAEPVWQGRITIRGVEGLDVKFA
ncbi:MAG: cytochrome P450 [Candidatus Aldehydirespiratoraceae bacterium]|jgi:cytochrome P450